MNLRLSRLLFVGQTTLVGESRSPESAVLFMTLFHAPHSTGCPSQFSRLGVAAITIGAALGGWPVERLRWQNRQTIAARVYPCWGRGS